MRLSLLLSSDKYSYTKTTYHEGAHEMNVPWRNMCRFLYLLVHDLSKYVRSHLDLSPDHFKSEEVLGAWDFTFVVYVKDTFNF
jgi:hypothetical protein